MILSTRISPTCARPCAGANGWAASRRRFSARAIPCRARRSRGWSGRGAISTSFSPTSSTSCAGVPTDIICVAGGWQFRTRSRFAGAIRAAGAGMLRNGGAPELTPTELLALTAIAYLQPVTRAELARLAGREISRDVIGRLKRLDLIDGALRAPEPGAPIAYVTTRKFLEAFGLASLRELPDLERLEDEGLLQRPRTDGDLDGILGLACDEERETDEDAADFADGDGHQSADW
jgi:chromosome segregation and condensation protein ScpB